jgi:hypothetical protein
MKLGWLYKKMLCLDPTITVNKLRYMYLEDCELSCLNRKCDLSLDLCEKCAVPS